MQTDAPRPMIQFACSGCKARIRAPRQLVGTSRPCPRCREQLVIRVALPSEQDICLVPIDAPSMRR